MLPRRLDTTLAHKAISLSPELSGTEKRVAGAIIDSFNRKSGQCDPSLNRIARLLSISRRTVIRAVEKLENLHFIHKVRHGGNLHRNSYQPNWAHFREIEAAWSVRFKTKHYQSEVMNASPFGCQTCRVASDDGGTQTFLINPSKETSSSRSSSEAIGGPNVPIGCEGHSRKELTQKVPGLEYSNASKQHGIRSLDAAHAAAERRWSTDLNNRYAATPAIYAKVIDAIDTKIQNAATEAELRRHGAGLEHIEERLQANDVMAPAHDLRQK